jgi:hypothetical protein
MTYDEFIILWLESDGEIPCDGAVFPAVIDDEGGTELLVILGTEFGVNAEVQAYLGPLGTVEDPPCYAGRGYGYTPISEDGISIVCYAPPTAPGSVFLTLVYGEPPQTVVAGNVTVLERNFKSKRFSFRSCFPPWYGVGPRNMELLPPVGEL